MTHRLDQELDELKKAEAEFFDASAYARSRERRIPFTADIRRATPVVGRPGVEPVDAKIYDIQQAKYRNLYLDAVAHRPHGRVLDICCGPGWLALELGRHGQHVDAYDISPVAIDLAKRMLAENPYTDAFRSSRFRLRWRNIIPITTTHSLKSPGRIEAANYWQG